MKQKPAGTEIDAQAVLACDAFQYFVERDSAAFLALLAEALHLGTYSFRESWTEGGSTFVRLVTKPDIASWIPAAVRSSIASSSEIEFHDIIEYDPQAIATPPYTLHVRTESPFLGEKLDVRTTLTIAPVPGPTPATLQRLQGHVRVRLFGVGRFIETAVRSNLVDTYTKLPGIIAKWEAYRAEAVRKGDPGVLLAGRPPVGGDIEYVRAVMQAPLAGMQTAPTAASDLAYCDAVEEVEVVAEAEAAGEAAAAAGGRRAAERRADGEGVSVESAAEAIEIAGENVLLGDGAVIDAGVSGLGPLPVLPPAVRHLRNMSVGSVASEGSEAPTDLEKRTPGTHGAEKAWRRFNRDYPVWEEYWKDVGVKAATVAHRGAIRAVYAVLGVLREVFRVIAIGILLGLVRFGILKIQPLRPWPRRHHRRVLSAPPPEIYHGALPSPRGLHAHHLSIQPNREEEENREGSSALQESPSQFPILPLPKEMKAAWAIQATLEAAAQEREATAAAEAAAQQKAAVAALLEPDGESEHVKKRRWFHFKA